MDSVLEKKGSHQCRQSKPAPITFGRHRGAKKGKDGRIGLDRALDIAFLIGDGNHDRQQASRDRQAPGLKCSLYIGGLARTNRKAR